MKTNGSGSAVAAPAPSPSFTIFALAEVRGQIGPCGCTSDPLGDISRTTKLIEDAKAKGPVLVLDAGSLLYAKNPVPPHLATQEELKADLLATVYRDKLKAAAVGLGPADIAKGPKGTRFPRVIANLQDAAYPAANGAAIHDVGGAKVGVFGVVVPSVLPGIKLTDPIAAGKQAVTTLRKDGAQIVVALVQASSKRDAVALARDIGGIDLTVAGLGAVAPEPERIEVEPDKVGDGWIVIPANRGQIVSRVDIWMRGPGPLADAIGRGTAAAKIARIDRQLAALDAELAKFAQDKDADPKFVKAKQSERDQLLAQKKQFEAQPLAIPAKGSFFTLEQVRINKTLACSPPVRDLIKAYDVAAGEANVKAAGNKKPPPAPKGKASYTGDEACSDCHQDAVDFWKTTVHAKAWKTLVDRGQQFDFECIGCHVTGWDKPGGSNLAFNEKLRNVQCEVCHGPGSIHVAKGGEEKPFAVVRNPAQDLCATQCHTKEHSDTFEYKAYMRDIVGPGHGAEMRPKLGAGPTGRELRSAALDKAGRTLGAGCVK